MEGFNVASGYGRGSERRAPRTEVLTCLLAGALVSLLLAALPGVAVAAPVNHDPRPAEGLLDSADLEALDQAEDAGRSHVTLLIAAEEDRTAAVVAGAGARGVDRQPRIKWCDRGVRAQP